MPRIFRSRQSLKARRSTTQQNTQSLPSLRKGEIKKVEKDASLKDFFGSNTKRMSMKRLRRSKSVRKAPKERKEIRKEDISSPRDSSML